MNAMLNKVWFDLIVIVWFQKMYLLVKQKMYFGHLDFMFMIVLLQKGTLT